MNSTPKYGVILTENFFTLIADKEYMITKSDERYSQAVALYKASDFDKLVLLMDRPAAIARYSKGQVQVFDGAVTYGGVALHNAITQRIIAFFQQGLPFEPLVAFLNNLYDNTSERVREKLYQFLERNNLGLTEAGNVIVYKMVNEDGTPFYHTGEFYEMNGEDMIAVSKYEVGHTYIFPRNRIQEGNDECGSQGLYVGNKTYWNDAFDERNNYIGTGKGRLLIAEVRPQDVCNVAHNEASKMVVCRLKLIGEYKTLKVAANRALATNEELLGVLSPSQASDFGLKPEGSTQAGRRYHNVRVGGKFAKRSS